MNLLRVYPSTAYEL